ncbi:MAG TPA: tRNA uridine(34) 5-carboxymethylaminomethyl modification radical SAM/GNAT enzyme Elp3 [Candidatus Paceibacterota bacterium]|nr:tRNA uridine(34) 5-carboxymethylaminomethyl modification radical SAM/GNAT enzyme Elp3 [Candidatus Paceibacterota bacterium]
MKPAGKNEVRKPTKTLSGVTPIAVMLKPRKCKHGVCRYCPSLNVPQSYTPLSPPVIRAKLLKYNAYDQVLSRLKAFKLMNHPTDKIELIVMGGTFLSYPDKYQTDFIKKCYDALNGKVSKNLESAKKLNEKSKNRCVALCIETRPDYCTEKHIKKMLEFGATRVELGVQAIDDTIYKKVNRGHTVKDVINATKRLRSAGFKIGYHLMPGLPGSSPEKDIEMFKEIFSNPNFKPDQIKIYPCQVIKGSILEEDYKKGLYKPYSEIQIKNLLIEIFKIVPKYCRVMRVMRELPPNFIVAGTTRISLRKDVEEYLRSSNLEINEIRFREIGFAQQHGKKLNSKISIEKIIYETNGGVEIFIQAVNKQGILFGLLRLRIPYFNSDNKVFIKELNNCAIIRELHVYGKSVGIGKKAKTKIDQHRGIGKRLMKEAENYIKSISKDKSITKIAVISGVGVREYYKKLGYSLKSGYMIKKIKFKK